MKAIGKHILAVIAGLATLFISNYLLILIIGLLGHVPILRSILFYPSDAGWAVLALPFIFAVYLESIVSYAICGSTRPTMVITILLFVAIFVSSIIVDGFLWRNLISYGLGTGTAIISLISGGE